VFVDVRPDTLNIDAQLIEAAITSRTRAIVPVHYAGVGCDMEAIVDIARRHDLIVIEDAAQALGSSLNGRPLGSFGALAALSFHETKNVMSGEKAGPCSSTTSVSSSGRRSSGRRGPTGSGSTAAR
jgi:dTDP-4-amino-4,6-dideoxygalactose transaminase